MSGADPSNSCHGACQQSLPAYLQVFRAKSLPSNDALNHHFGFDVVQAGAAVEVEQGEQFV